MAVTLYEKLESRELLVERGSAGFTGRLIAAGSDNEAEIYQAAVLDTTVSYFGTLFRSSIRCKPRGGGYWDVDVEYAPIPARDAIQAPGLDGGAGGPGGDGQPPVQAPDPDQPLGPGYAFSTIGGTTRIYQNLSTIKIVQSLAAIADGRALVDNHGAINVTKDGAEGTDVVSKNTEFQIDVRRNNVTMNYIRTLASMTGTVNNAKFYANDGGEVLYLGAEGRFTMSDLWQVTHKFAVEPNRTDLVVSRDKDGVAQIAIPGLTEGWDYVEVSYYEKPSNGARVLRAEQAVVHRLYRRTNFALLEVGA